MKELGGEYGDSKDERAKSKRRSLERMSGERANYEE
jgi:hypothetical protein